MTTTLKLLTRLLTVITLAASAIVVTSPGAQAAIRVFAADDGTCVGTQVLRCLEFRYDDVNERMRARAEITDAAGGGDFNVDILLVMGGGFIKPGDDQPSATWERLESPLFPCAPGQWMEESFDAVFRWRNLATNETGEQYRSGTARFTCT